VVSPEADDQALVAACRAGDRQAFKSLMQRYQRKVYSVAYGFLRNQEDALDVVQESFIKVHRYLANFEGNSSFYTWLYRIVTNLCIDHIRKNKRHRELEFDDGLRHDGEDPGGRSRCRCPAWVIRPRSCSGVRSSTPSRTGSST
jgi:RNA polymerase sigma-70 factor (ECF subfamily)